MQLSFSPVRPFSNSSRLIRSVFEQLSTNSLPGVPMKLLSGKLPFGKMTLIAEQMKIG